MTSRLRLACWIVLLVPISWLVGSTWILDQREPTEPAAETIALRFGRSTTAFIGLRVLLSGVHEPVFCEPPQVGAEDLEGWVFCEPGRRTDVRKSIEDRIKLTSLLAREDLGHLTEPWRLRHSGRLRLDPDSADRNERALDRFLEATQVAPEDSEAWNDLGVAYLVYAAVADRPSGYLEALAAFERALDHRADFLEARFNRAVSFEILALWGQAERAWRELAELGPDSGVIALRARQGAERAARAADARRSPSALRLAGEKLVFRWAEQTGKANSDDRSESEQLFQTEDALAAVARWSGVQGDSFLRDQLLDESGAFDGRRLSPKERLGLAALGRARAGSPYSQCNGDLALGSRLLEKSNSGFRFWAALDLAICDYFDRRLDEASSKLTDILETSPMSYRALGARTQWILGLVRMVQSRFSEADRIYHESRNAYLGLGETDHAAYLSSLLAKNRWFIGDREEAWRHRLRALHQRRLIANPERRYTIFEEAVLALRGDDRPRDSLPFVEGMIDAAAESHDLDVLAYSLLERNRIFRGMSQMDLARKDVAAAKAAWTKLPRDHLSHRRLDLEIAVAEALGGGEGTKERTQASIDRAIGFFAGSKDRPGDQVEILKLLRKKAEVEIAHGDPHAAESILLEALNEAERQRRNVIEPEHRAAYLLRVDDLVDRLVRLELDELDNPRRALAALEWQSHRTLSDLAGIPQLAADRQAFDDLVDRAQSRLDPDTTVLRYGQVGRHLLLFVLDRSDLRFRERKIDVVKLERWVESFRTAVQQAESKMELTSERLAREMFLTGEAAPKIDSGRILIIPTGVLRGIPVDFLRTEDGLLGHQFSVAFAVGLAQLAEPKPRKNRHQPLGTPRVLVVSNPTYSLERFPNTKPLRYAHSEGAAVANLYETSIHLTGEKATREHIVEELTRAEIIHIAAHAVVDSQHPQEGGLLIAGGKQGREGDVLTIGEISTLDLSAEHVIIVSCSSGFGKFSGGGEESHLAAAFILAGARRVTASLWEMEDHDSFLCSRTMHGEMQAALNSPPVGPWPCRGLVSWYQE